LAIISRLFPFLSITDDNVPSGYIVYKAGDTESFQYIDFIERIPKKTLDSKHNIMLDGYFINPRYLPNDYASIIKIIPTTDSKVLQHRYYFFRDMYFIHIRLGDYVGNELYKIPLEKYYNECIVKIKETNPSAKFVICTNEYSKNLNKYLDVIKQATEYQVQIPEEDEMDTLYIMSKCRGGICSNSTLSWFGCYFQCLRALPDAKKHIYMPYPWVNKTWHGFNDDNTRDIYPEWTTVFDTTTSTFR
jgi:hypothetical protein